MILFQVWEAFPLSGQLEMVWLERGFFSESWTQRRCLWACIYQPNLERRVKLLASPFSATKPLHFSFYRQYPSLEDEHFKHFQHLSPQKISIDSINSITDTCWEDWGFHGMVRHSGSDSLNKGNSSHKIDVSGFPTREPFFFFCMFSMIKL